MTTKNPHGLTPANVIVPASLTAKLADYDASVRPRGALEMRIVAGLIQHMAAKGFVPYRVYDGEAMTYCRKAYQTGGIEAAKECAMLACFAVDDSSLRFIPARVMRDSDPLTSNERRAVCESVEHGVLLICGNGEDILCDWNYAEDDDDGFSAAMEEFAEHVESLY